MITLEDVLEEVIQDEIVDESDQYETNEQSKRVERRGGKDMLTSTSIMLTSGLASVCCMDQLNQPHLSERCSYFISSPGFCLSWLCEGLVCGR